jgi:hypothetical protein
MISLDVDKASVRVLLPDDVHMPRQYLVGDGVVLHEPLALDGAQVPEVVRGDGVEREEVAQVHKPVPGVVGHELLNGDEASGVVLRAVQVRKQQPSLDTRARTRSARPALLCSG